MIISSCEHRHKFLPPSFGSRNRLLHPFSVALAPFKPRFLSGIELIDSTGRNAVIGQQAREIYGRMRLRLQLNRDGSRIRLVCLSSRKSRENVTDACVANNTAPLNLSAVIQGKTPRFLRFPEPSEYIKTTNCRVPFSLATAESRREDESFVWSQIR